MNSENELRRLFRAADATLPGEPLDWNLTITRARRARLVRMVAAGAVAAAVVAAAAFGTSALRNQAAPGPIPPAGPTSTPAPTPADPAEEGVSLENVVPTVRAYIEAAADADARTMWRLMSSAARAPFHGNFARWRRFAESGLYEGYGPWSTADPHYDTTVLASSGDGAAVVVTLSGKRVADGVEERNQLAIPVRVEGGPDGRVLVEPFLEPNEWAFVSPQLGEVELARAPGDVVFVVDVPRRPLEAVVSVAHADAIRATKQQGVARIRKSPIGRDLWRLTWRPDEPLAPGEHIVTYSGLFESGLSAEALRFQVE